VHPRRGQWADRRGHGRSLARACLGCGNRQSAQPWRRGNDRGHPDLHEMNPLPTGSLLHKAGFLMTTHTALAADHNHFFLGSDHQRNERRVWLVIALTASMMLVEIIAGTLYGSMALVADGWHMSTHAGSMLITVMAYRFARRHVDNPRFSFGTGKLGDLAGFASAVLLALIALLIGWESLVRLSQPIPIDFNQAIAVATVGLVINLVCAWLLKDDHAHHGH